VISYAAHARSANVTIWTLMLPPTVWFLLQEDALRRGMALGGICYVLIAYRAVGILTFFLRRSFQLSHELGIAREAAEALARTDELTQLRNRRAFYEQGALAVEQAKRYGHPLSLLVLDIDRFKAINDGHGHAGGDQRSRRWLACCARLCAPRTSPRGSVARSSACCCRRRVRRRSRLAEARAAGCRRAARAASRRRDRVHVQHRRGRVRSRPPRRSTRCSGAPDQALYQAKREGP
jgi:hypothetical protein